MCELKGRIPCERHNLMSGVMKVAGSIKPLGQSGPIADLWPWTLWGLAIVYARKHRPVIMPEQIFLTLVPYRTKGRTIKLIVSAKFLGDGDHVATYTDFLSSLQSTIGPAGVAGVTLVHDRKPVAKTFEGGCELLEEQNMPVESLTTVLDMSSGNIVSVK